MLRYEHISHQGYARILTLHYYFLIMCILFPYHPVLSLPYLPFSTTSSLSHLPYLLIIRPLPSFRLHQTKKRRKERTDDLCGRYGRGRVLEDVVKRKRERE